MRLFHFSDDPRIAIFEPRPVLVPSVRKPGMSWLNGPLVWAIDDWHQPMYLFPRDCPRVLVWPVATTTDTDRASLWDGGASRMVAYVEAGWLARIETADLTRYELPAATFDSVEDAGMWVSRVPVVPIGREAIGDLPGALQAATVDLRAVDSLVPLRPLWETSLHVSGIRLRHAAGWPG